MHTALTGPIAPLTCSSKPLLTTKRPCPGRRVAAVTSRRRECALCHSQIRLAISCHCSRFTPSWTVQERGLGGAAASLLRSKCDRVTSEDGRDSRRARHPADRLPHRGRRAPFTLPPRALPQHLCAARSVMVPGCRQGCHGGCWGAIGAAGLSWCLMGAHWCSRSVMVPVGGPLAQQVCHGACWGPISVAGCSRSETFAVATV